jgi:hypothetical protein
MIRQACLFLALAACAMPNPISADAPQTAAEQSQGARTSTVAEVQQFLAQLPPLPKGERLHLATFGKTHEGRDMTLVIAANPPLGSAAEVLASGKLRLLVNANIHAGEVEGKEAVQMILREIALGQHEELLRHAVLLFVPVYNADGNERFDRANRATQNGPEQGVGTRANAQELDLNRDFLKVEAPETRALLGLMNAFDPHLFMDLHTTNGSYHGYHLTYSPSLSTNVDADIDRFARRSFLPSVRQQMEQAHGFRTLDYGNFTDTDPREWVTYDHRPRFGTNYMGLRNRLSVLSEAYSYVDFPTRISATRAFVLTVLAQAVKDRDSIRNLLATADAKTAAGAWTFGHDSMLSDATTQDVLVGSVQEMELPDDLGVRRIADGQYQSVSMATRLAFDSRQQNPPPLGWLLRQPSQEMRDLLAWHGVESEVWSQQVQGQLEVFEVSACHREEILFQGHFELKLEGQWRATEEAAPMDALWIPAHQALGRVAAQLLDPLSEDSASTWDRLEGWEDAQTGKTVPFLLRIRH